MISDALPLIKMAKWVAGFAKKLGIANESLNKIHQTAEDTLQQADLLTLPDRITFNDTMRFPHS